MMDYQPKSEFCKYILDKYNNNYITESEAYFILIKWFDVMNRDDITDIPEDKYEEVFNSLKNKYNEIIMKKFKESLILVDLLKDTDKKSRDILVNHQVLYKE